MQRGTSFGFDLAQAFATRTALTFDDLIHIKSGIAPAPFNQGWEYSLFQKSQQ